MGAIKDLAYDIEQLYIEGFSIKNIALQLECPQEFVEDWIKENGLGSFSLQDEFSPFVTVNS
jgi:hypothetical protein